MQDWDKDIRKRKEALEAAGAKVKEVDMPAGRFPFENLPSVLSELGIRSVMIEGGASVIDQVFNASFLNQLGQERPLADLIIVTVAPSKIGADGVSYGAGVGLEAIPSEYVQEHSERLGKDSILVYRAQHARSPEAV